MPYATYAALLLGSSMTMIGIVTGATGLLSGDLPLWLAGAGTLLVYVATAIAGARALWRMDQ